MQIAAFVLMITGFGLWVSVYLHGKQFLNSGQLSFVTTRLGGQEATVTICGLIGATLSVLGTLGIFGLITIQ